MPIPVTHAPLTVDGSEQNLDHLDAFTASIPGKGREKGAPLQVFVVFSCHVYTERAKHGEDHHMDDHHGTKRAFDPERYAMSFRLPDMIRVQVETDCLTFISRSFGGNDNLILLEDDKGQTWTIVYCLEPSGDGVRMEVLSAHPKKVDQKKISRRNISYFARKCIFDGERIPNL